MNDEPPLFSGALADVVARYPYNACAYSRALADRSAPFRRQVDPDLHELDEEEDVGPDPFGEEEGAAGCYGLKQRFPDRVQWRQFMKQLSDAITSTRSGKRCLRP